MQIRVAVLFMCMSLLATGCANHAFQLASGSAIEKRRMETLLVEPVTLGKEVKSEVPTPVYDSKLRAISKEPIKLLFSSPPADPPDGGYVLFSEVTKYKPGSPVLRFLITPVFLGGLGGSYVYVQYELRDPQSKRTLGTGTVRKANLWGGIVGASINAQGQLEEAAVEVLDGLLDFYEEADQ
jgi:hypothetical protein